jgi:gamma-glutamyltranspeptidase/glutathione hydrolase
VSNQKLIYCFDTQPQYGAAAFHKKEDTMTTTSNLLYRRNIRGIVRIIAVALLLAVPFTVTALAEVQWNICEDNSDPSRTSPVKGRDFMVAAAHPAAVQAGCDVLKSGGTAIDAAVAVQAVLAVVEPAASGMAGGSLITYWDKEAKRVRFFEGLSRAPAAVTDGLRTPTEDDVASCGVTSFSSRVEVTGRAFGVPGTLRVLEMVHDIYGGENWNELFEAGINLAEIGFPMPLYMNTILGESTRGLERCQYPDLRNRYCDGDTPKPVGTTVFNLELAQVMREVRDGGADAFYDPEGTIAPAIIERVSQGPCRPTHTEDGPAVIPSLMTVDDFAAYAARERDPICREVFNHIICSSAPPAFGGTAILYMLELMEKGGIRHMKPGSAEHVHLFIEASRLAQADRRQYIGDPDYHYNPVEGLLDKGYLSSRFELFNPDAAIDLTLDDTADVNMIGNPPGGLPILAPWHSNKHTGLSELHRSPFYGLPGRGSQNTGARLPSFAAEVGLASAETEKLSLLGIPSGNLPTPDASQIQDMTSHISIIDAYGNALSMTTTNNTSFGSQSEARGITLNNVQTNFTRLNSISPGKPANIMESMKKARTSVAPTLVFTRNGRLKLVVGAAGGGAIPDYVVQTILNVLLYKMDPQEAINQAHVSGQAITSNCGGVIGARSEVESDTPLASLVEDLNDLGHPCARATRLRSGLTAINVRPNGILLGAADPRRDGIAMGE